MVSKDDVRAAYRMLFGREPENETVVSHYATEVSNLRALRELFMNSAEFRASLEKMQSPRPPRPSFNGPPMDVEVDASPEKLHALFTKTAAQWQHLGETEPHWSVLTNDSYFQRNFNSNREAFYASGVSELAMFDATLKRARIHSDQYEKCVELGCGVGRVTAPLAQRFGQVVGVDISPAHLRVAQEKFASSGIANVSLYHLKSIEDVSRLEPFDVLYSRIVLQHNPPPVINRILADLFDRLRPGGIAFFQLPTYKAGYRFRVDEYLDIENESEMEMHFFPQAVLLELITDRQCRVLEIREDDLIGLSVTSVSNSILVQKLA